MPLHATAASALDRYLELRRRTSIVSDYVASLNLHDVASVYQPAVGESMGL